MAKDTTGGKAFDQLAKALVQVPKKELVRQQKRWQKNKKKRKK